jgi:DNA-binding IclR family transcriptional regulator
MPSEIKSNQSYHLASVVAPIFDGHNNVVFVLGLMGFADHMTGSRIEKMGHRLREACDRITVFIAGKHP